MKRIGGLTRRQRQVIALHAQGHSSKHIARMLGLHEDTIRRHMTDACKDAGASNRVHLVALAVHHKLVQPFVGVVG